METSCRVWKRVDIMDMVWIRTRVSALNNKVIFVRLFLSFNYIGLIIYQTKNSFIGETYEKRGGLRALCMKNPRAAQCMAALRARQNDNLFF